MVRILSGSKSFFGEQGYIALLSVLILGAVSLSVALVLLTTGTDSQKAALVTQHSAQARGLAASCGDEALQQLRDNNAFTGTNSLTVGQGNCSYTVTNTGSSTRTIDTTGNVSDVTRRVKIYVTITSSSISITSWQEVADA